MYENHFKLNERPFRNVPDTKMFFDGGGRGDVLRALRFAIESGEGIIKVVGEVGSGKTMLCRMLDESLSGKVQVVFLANPSLEPEYILHAVAQELGLPIEITTNRYTVQQALQKYLLKQHENNKRVVVLIEESQCMPPRTLEEIRLMSNLETEKQKLLQLVLFGQPELDTLLSRVDLRQFNERISYALYLKPFTLDEHLKYLNHRLYVAGYRGSDLFNEQVVKLIYKFAKGSVRRINLLADKTLLAAYAYNDPIINIKHARSAAEDSQYIERVNTGIPIKMVMVASVIIVSIFVFFLQESYVAKEPEITKNSNKISEKVLGSTETQSKAGEYLLGSLETVKKRKVDTSSETLSEEVTKKTMEWVKTADKSQYTIQLMTAFVDRAEDLYDLEKILKNKIEPDEIDDFLVFRGVANGQRVFIVCYRTFSGLSMARSAINGLPSFLQNYKPFVRNISSILVDIGAINV